MKYVTLASAVAATVLVVGCETPVPPGVERGPHGTIAYDVKIDTSEPGARVQANGADIGVTPVTLRIWGDKDGTFHDFGSYEYVIQAFPLHTNQYTQTRVFRTGKMFTPQDYIPKEVAFDLNQPPTYPTAGYAPPGGYGPPPAYYYPPPYYYYGPPVYWGSTIYIGPGHYHHGGAYYHH